MKAVLAFALALAVPAACAAPMLTPTAPEPAEESVVSVKLRNGDFEEPARPDNRCAYGWTCAAHAGPAYRFTIEPESPGPGRQALCIQRISPEPWALASQALHDTSLSGAAMRLSLRLKADHLEGEGAGPWALVYNANGTRLLNASRLVKSTRDWETVTLDFVVPAGAAIVEVGATIEGGGRACVDDVRLDRRVQP